MQLNDAWQMTLVDYAAEGSLALIDGSMDETRFGLLDPRQDSLTDFAKDEDEDDNGMLES